MASEQKKRKTDRSKHSHQAQLCVKVDEYDIDVDSPSEPVWPGGNGPELVM